MAKIVTIDGQSYLKRDPLGVLGLSFITFGIYFFYWYYKVNDEIRRFERDDSISPTRSLMAMIFGWLIFVPPFIAMYNTAKHVRAMEQRVGVQQQLEPALAIVLMFVFSIGNGIYVQEHLNRAWERALGTPAVLPPTMPPVPPPPPPGGSS
jgi:H+/Cl- antiporter ClcA